MSWPLLRWFRRNRRGTRAPAVGSPVGDETMLFTTGLRLPDVAARAEPADPSPAAPPDGLPETPPGSAFLVVHHGPQAGARFLLSATVTGVGRSPKQDILLDDATVSRAHAEFVRCADGFLVRDLNSLNGTYVGAERVAEAVLRAGDVVRIGKFRLVYHPGPLPGEGRSANDEGDESAAPSGQQSAPR